MEIRRLHASLTQGVLGAGAMLALASALHAAEPVYFDVARGSHPHDVAAAPNAHAGRRRVAVQKHRSRERSLVCGRDRRHCVLLGIQSHGRVR